MGNKRSLKVKASLTKGLMKNSDEQKTFASGLDQNHHVQNKSFNSLCKVRDRNQRFNILQSIWNMLWRDFQKLFNVRWCVLVFLLSSLIYFPCFFCFQCWICWFYFPSTMMRFWKRKIKTEAKGQLLFCRFVLSLLVSCLIEALKRKIQTEAKGQLAVALDLSSIM